MPTSDLAASLDFFTQKLGFRLDMIMPADSPSVAVVSGNGTSIRLEQGTTDPSSPLLELLCNYTPTDEFPEREFTAPGGIRIRLIEHSAPLAFLLSRSFSSPAQMKVCGRQAAPVCSIAISWPGGSAGR
jgi:catechol 2,3-dioxygenase-like lactoylglutathione lyase family enzyme